MSPVALYGKTQSGDLVVVHDGTIVTYTLKGQVHIEGLGGDLYTTLDDPPMVLAVADAHEAARAHIADLWSGAEAMTPFERLEAWLAEQPGVRDVKAYQTVGAVWVVWLAPGPFLDGDTFVGRGESLDAAIDDALRDAAITARQSPGLEQ